MLLPEEQAGQGRCRLRVRSQAPVLPGGREREGGGVCWRQSSVPVLRDAPMVRVMGPLREASGDKEASSLGPEGVFGGSARPRPGPGSLCHFSARPALLTRP